MDMKTSEQSNTKYYKFERPNTKQYFSNIFHNRIRKVKYSNNVQKTNLIDSSTAIYGSKCKISYNNSLKPLYKSISPQPQAPNSNEILQIYQNSINSPLIQPLPWKSKELLSPFKMLSPDN